MENLNDQIKTLPELPGVYQYFNKNADIIYVGKAKNLKKRVSSYFNKTQNNGKTNVLVKQIYSLKYIIVETEEDALLLENNLIKKYQPRYNILLKDGKTYPSICITKELYPRIFKTRNIIKNGSEYYGPYSSNYTINSIIEIIHQLYPIRNCKLPLNTDSVKLKKHKVCLQYHIKKCNGVCEGLESSEKYNEYITEIKKIIEGDANKISKILLDRMKILANDLKFEEANILKEKYALIENYKSKSIISNTVLENTDIFSYDESDNSAFINILRISNGSIVQGYTIEYRIRDFDKKEEILALGVVELRERLKSDSKEIVLPFDIEVELNGIEKIIPKKGDRKKLLDLSLQNVKQYKLDKLKQKEKSNSDFKNKEILEIIKDKLQLSKIPLTIDCIDNSNIQGSDAVAGCIVYKNGKASKKDYRKYIIKTVIGPDDYASMREITERRYGRMKDEDSSLPDLIVADGGLGQMEAIRETLVNKLGLDIQIIGLAKNERHKTKEILVGFPPKIIGLSPTDKLFNFFAAMQDEVHRYAIKFHRDKRSKKQISSVLDSIPGIGEKTKNELIKHFKSINRIKKAKKIELEKVVGSNRASILYEYLKQIETR